MVFFSRRSRSQTNTLNLVEHWNCQGESKSPCPGNKKEKLLKNTFSNLNEKYFCDNCLVRDNFNLPDKPAVLKVELEREGHKLSPSGIGIR